MNKYSTILVCPPCLGKNVRLGENLGIRYICSYLRNKGHNVDILECDIENISIEKIAEKIICYEVIGFSLNFSEQYKSTKAIIDQLKLIQDKRNDINKVKYILAGGHYATFQHKFILKDCPDIKYIILGEAENILDQLLNYKFQSIDDIPNLAYKNNRLSIIRTQKRPQNIEINIYPFPYRDQGSYHLKQKHFTMITARGCYSNCAFCSVNSFSKLSGYKRKWRLRSPDNIIKEILYYKKHYNIKALSFVDSAFVGTDKQSKDRVLKLCELFKNNCLNISFSIECKSDSVNEDIFKELQNVGLKNVFVGLESGTQKGLDIFNKRLTIQDNQNAINILNKLSIDSQYGFINFYPEMEYADFENNILFLYNNGILTSESLSSRLCIYHGTSYQLRNIQSVRYYDDNYEIMYKFLDNRLEHLFAHMKKCKLIIKPLEINIAKKIFNLHLSQLNDENTNKYIGFIQDIKKQINEVLFGFAKDVFLYIQKNNSDFDFSKQYDNLHLMVTEVEGNLKNVNVI